MSLKESIRKYLHRKGFDIIRYPYEEREIMKLIFENNINLIFDVGANTGQYSLKIRSYGYDKKIVSFEPLSEIFGHLKKSCSRDNNWSAFNYALGNFDGESTINIAGNSFSSSLLEMMPAHLNAAPESGYVTTEKIIVKRLDSVFNEFYRTGDNIFLKIDTQGSEKNILEGAEKSLASIKGILLEMSLIELYKGELLYNDMIDYLKHLGFQLCRIENEFSDPKTKQLLQINGIFFRQ